MISVRGLFVKTEQGKKKAQIHPGPVARE